MSKPRGHWLTWALLPLPHQLEENIRLTDAVKPLDLPRGTNRLHPEQKCTVAGWGKVAPEGRSSDTLREVELTVQKDTVCENLFKYRYNRNTQLCVGNPAENKASFQVMLRICLAWLWGKGCLGKN